MKISAQKKLRLRVAKLERDKVMLRDALFSADAVLGHLWSIFTNPNFTDRYDDAGTIEKVRTRVQNVLGQTWEAAA